MLQEIVQICMDRYPEGACLSPFTISPYLSPTATIATSTCPSQLQFLQQGWVLNYFRRRGWEDEARGVIQWRRQEFSLLALIMKRSATLNENVKEMNPALRSTDGITIVCAFVNLAYPLQLDYHADWLMGGSLPKTRKNCKYDTI